MVAEVTLNDVAASEPKLTAVAPLKPLPVTVTDVPPENLRDHLHGKSIARGTSLNGVD